MPEEEIVEEVLEYGYITARQLIHRLMDLHDLEDEIIIKDKDGNQLHNVTIVAKKSESLGSLFG